jgi:hypothetical protein
MNTPISLGDALHADALEAFNTDPAARLEFATVITLKHCPDDLTANVRERFDEPFEQEHACWELNTIQGPWVEHQSGGMFRWLPTRAADLDTVQTGEEFLGIVYRHIVPT